MQKQYLDKTAFMQPEKDSRRKGAWVEGKQMAN